MEYTPNGKRLILTRKKHELETKSGIVLPDTMTEKKLSEGYIERVGLGCENEALEEGMHVVFAQFAGQEISIDDEVYLVIPEEDVLVYGWDDDRDQI
jgi:co-chaperonin GroES (HSP10)